MPGPRGLPGRTGHCEATCGQKLAYVWQPSQEPQELRRKRRHSSKKQRKQKFIDKIIGVNHTSKETKSKNWLERSLLGKKRHNS